MKKILSASEMKLILGGIGGSFKGCGDGDEIAFTCITTYVGGATSKGVICAVNDQDAVGMIWQERNWEQGGDAGIKNIACTPK